MFCIFQNFPSSEFSLRLIVSFFVIVASLKHIGTIKFNVLSLYKSCSLLSICTRISHWLVKWTPKRWETKNIYFLTLKNKLSREQKQDNRLVHGPLCDVGTSQDGASALCCHRSHIPIEKRGRGGCVGGGRGEIQTLRLNHKVCIENNPGSNIITRLVFFFFSFLLTANFHQAGVRQVTN